MIGISDERRARWLETVREHLDEGESVDEVALLALPAGVSGGETADAAHAALAGSLSQPSIPRFVAAVATDRRVLVCREDAAHKLIDVLEEQELRPLRMGFSIPGVTRAGVRGIGETEYLAIPGFKKYVRALVDAVNRRVAAQG